MKTVVKFKLWDTRSKSYLTENFFSTVISFSNKEMADEYRHNYLHKGNYPGCPYSVIEIHEYQNNDFVKLVQF